MIGGLSNYRKALSHIQSIDAELKLIIPGNHDVSLDPAWWAENLDEDDDDPDEPIKARELFDQAKAHGIRFLDEGTHKITLRDGRTFSIFASPYTPAFGGYAFSYAEDEDHFNTGPSTIPEGVDIVMTHGPPLPPSPADPSNYFLDLGHNGEHCGCPKLYRAVKRARPQIHCFGHIHEGFGAQAVTWSDHGEDKIGPLTKDCTERLATEQSRTRTLLVNAAIMNHGDVPNNRPWMVDLMVNQ